MKDPFNTFIEDSVYENTTKYYKVIVSRDEEISNNTKDEETSTDYDDYKTLVS